MLFNRNPKLQSENVDAQKANKVREVEALPDRADEGDEVIIKHVRYTRSKGKWQGVNPIVGARRKGDKIEFTRADGSKFEV